MIDEPTDYRGVLISRWDEGTVDASGQLRPRMDFDDPQKCVAITLPFSELSRAFGVGYFVSRLNTSTYMEPMSGFEPETC